MNEEKSIDINLDELRFRLHELTSLERYPVKNVFFPDDGDELDHDGEGDVLVTIVAPEGIKVGPNTKIVFIDEKDQS